MIWVWVLSSRLVLVAESSWLGSFWICGKAVFLTSPLFVQAPKDSSSTGTSHYPPTSFRLRCPRRIWGGSTYEVLQALQLAANAHFGCQTFGKEPQLKVLALLRSMDILLLRLSKLPRSPSLCPNLEEKSNEQLRLNTRLWTSRKKRGLKKKKKLIKNFLKNTQKQTLKSLMS